jgi:drug/metabolite transporter (DMT)-like permease
MFDCQAALSMSSWQPARYRAPMSLRAPTLTATALLCFASNSLLCRLALAARESDAATFTAVRLASGALVLTVLASGRSREPNNARSKDWLSAVLLFGYAAPFSYAYLRLGAAMGALILFASVQATMIGWGVAHGERLPPLAWLGIVLALAGLVALTAPGAAAPDLRGAAGMAFAGTAWGAYSLRGRIARTDPLLTTTSSFVRTLPFAAVLLGVEVAASRIEATTRGLALAVISGGLASGLGYAVWYAVLPSLTAARAAVLQLLVPILAASGAMAWLGERVSLRFLLASVAILGGVALTIRAQRVA